MKKPVSRRRFLKTSTLAAGAAVSLPHLRAMAAEPPSVDGGPGAVAAPGAVSIRLLDGEPMRINSGVSFAVPWPKGSVKRDATFKLTAESRELPLQTWPLAYWPDGSLKWSGFATVVPADLKASLS